MKIQKVSILLIAIALTSVTFGVPVFFIYQNIKGLIVNELGNKATSIAATAAGFIEQDIESYKGLTDTDALAAGSGEEAYYARMQKLFQRLKRETGVNLIYTEQKTNDTEIAYVLNGEDPQSELFLPLGSTNNLSAIEDEVYETGKSVASGLVHDDVSGEYLTGLAPIMDDRTGEVIGLVGVDYSLEYINVLLAKIKNFVFMSFFLLMVLSTMVLYVLLGMRAETIYADYLTGLYTKRYHDFFIKRAMEIAKIEKQAVLSHDA